MYSTQTKTSPNNHLYQNKTKEVQPMPTSTISSFSTKFASMMTAVTAYTPFRTVALRLNGGEQLPKVLNIETLKMLYRPFTSNFICTHQLAMMQFFSGFFNSHIKPHEEKSNIQKIGIAAISGAASTPTTTPCEFMSLLESNNISSKDMGLQRYFRGTVMMTIRQSLLGIGSLALPEIFVKNIQYYFPKFSQENPWTTQMGSSFAGSGISSVVSQLPEVARVKMQLNPNLSMNQAIKDSWNFMKTEKGIKAAGYRFVVIAIALTVYRTSSEKISQMMSKRETA
jgi:hypothetical protein